MKKGRRLSATEIETISAAVEMVVDVAEEFQDTIKEQTTVLLTGRNIQKISSLLRVPIDHERIFDLGYKGILDSLIEDCLKAREYVKAKANEKKISVTGSNDKKFDALSLIRPLKHASLLVREEIIKPKQSKKIRCAAFCNLLREDEYFIKKPTNQELVDFAKDKYDKDITNQLLPAKRRDRQMNEQEIKDTLKDILDGRGYGRVP